jgi:hypothetical protein
MNGEQGAEVAISEGTIILIRQFQPTSVLLREFGRRIALALRSMTPTRHNANPPQGKARLPAALRSAKIP